MAGSLGPCRRLAGVGERRGHHVCDRAREIDAGASSSKAAMIRMATRGRLNTMPPAASGASRFEWDNECGRCRFARGRRALSVRASRLAELNGERDYCNREIEGEDSVEEVRG